MALNFATYKTALAELMVTSESDPDFLSFLPNIIAYAEMRIYRELDLLTTVTRDASATCIVADRNFTLPSTNGRFVVVNGINIVSPAGTLNPDSGVRNQTVPVSRDFMDAVWPSIQASGIPTSFAMVTDQLVIFGPVPDATYTVEVIGTIRPNPLSATNTETYLTLYLPDLFLAASMVMASGFQKNFGAQADDPKMSSSWEDQYKTLVASANIEENRKKFSSGAWGSLSPTPIATPSR